MRKPLLTQAHPAATPPLDKKAFYQELFSLAIPIGLQSLLTALIGATDALMLGRFSQDAVSAVSLANQVAFLMSLFTISIVGGGGALMAQYWGRNDRAMVKNLLCMMMKWSLGISAAFFLLAMLAPEAIMRVYTPDAALIAIGASYLRAVAASYLFTGLTQCYFVVMKLEGKANKSVWISVATLVTDMVLDLFLIYGLAGAPRLGANGSAYSTVVVELVALAWCVAESHRGTSVHPDAAGFRWRSKAVTKDFVRIAFPTLMAALAWGLGISLHSFLMGHLGTDATAAASITNVIQEMITCVCKGVSAGAGIMIGKLLGQNLFDDARAYGRELCKVSIYVGFIHMALTLLLVPVIPACFLLSDAARRYLTRMLLFNALYVFAYSINTVVVCGIFPAGGDARYDAISVFFASWCFALPLAALAQFAFHLPVMTVYILMCSDEIVKVPFLVPRYRKYLWLNNLTRDEAAVQAPAP